jgi:hypothetical protein
MHDKLHYMHHDVPCLITAPCCAVRANVAVAAAVVGFHNPVLLG